MGHELYPYTKICLPIAIMVLMAICAACSNSPTSEDEQDKESPDLGKILKDMALIPAGDFMMGSPEGEGAFDEHPQHTVYLDAYYIDKYEVTNAQFKEFVEATGYVTDAERKGYGEVWNPKSRPSWRRRNFSDVNWRCPHAWIDNERYPNTPHPEAWKNYNIMGKLRFVFIPTKEEMLTILNVQLTEILHIK